MIRTTYAIIRKADVIIGKAQEMLRKTHVIIRKPDVMIAKAQEIIRETQEIIIYFDKNTCDN